LSGLDDFCDDHHFIRKVAAGISFIIPIARQVDHSSSQFPINDTQGYKDQTRVSFIVL